MRQVVINWWKGRVYGEAVGFSIPSALSHPVPRLEVLLRAAVFGTFIGHGYFALLGKESWLPLITQFGFDHATALNLLYWIGWMDVITAFLSLIYPVRLILLWAALWAFAAALSRVTAGDPIAELIERAANWSVPLALLYLQGFPSRWNQLFKIR